MHKSKFETLLQINKINATQRKKEQHLWYYHASNLSHAARGTAISNSRQAHYNIISKNMQLFLKAHLGILNKSTHEKFRKLIPDAY